MKIKLKNKRSIEFILKKSIGMEIQLNKERNIILTKDHILIFKNNSYDHPVLPSYIWDVGTMFWIKSGMYHRELKPAMIFKSGKKEYYDNGIFIKEEK